MKGEARLSLVGTRLPHWVEFRCGKFNPVTLSNTTAENLWSARNVSTVGSTPSVSSTQSEEFIALKQQYQQLSMNYDQLRQMIMEMRSKMGDDTCATPFWPYGPGNNQPPPPPPAPPLF